MVSPLASLPGPGGAGLLPPGQHQGHRRGAQLLLLQFHPVHHCAGSGLTGQLHPALPVPGSGGEWPGVSFNDCHTGTHTRAYHCLTDCHFIQAEQMKISVQNAMDEELRQR